MLLVRMAHPAKTLVPNGYAHNVIMGRIDQTTATDDGSVDFASLHGCNLVGQCRSSEAVCQGASHRPDSLTDFIKYLPIVCTPMKYPG